MLDRIPTINTVDLHNKRVFIREDLNVPLHEGNITDDARIQRALPSIQQALSANAAVTLASHLGRPKSGEINDTYSLAPVAKRLSELLSKPVILDRDWQNNPHLPKAGEVVLLENIRFAVGETDNAEDLAKTLASRCDIFIMDAFASAHRAHASTVGIAQFAPQAIAGPLLVAELTALSQSLDHPGHPLVAIVGGSKVSSKIGLLNSLIRKVDTLIVGGGIANTFLKASGVNIGKSLYEESWVTQARNLLENARDIGVNIPLPKDVVVASAIDQPESAQNKAVNEISDNDAIFDVGTETQASYLNLFNNAATIVWNGPVGVFEIPAFSHGTLAMSKAIAKSSGFSVAGGGDTLAALSQFGLADQISYLCTGGGAFLEYLEGHELPAIAALRQHYQPTVAIS